ncbi:putative xyloglucan endotransglucosylase/hydrolase protein 26 [Drosera capensis]
MISETNGERSYGAVYRWLVDGTPIRVFRNYHDPEINFPGSQAMRAFASLWNADQWATQGGRVKTDWSLAPFTAKFQNFEMKACVWRRPKSIHYCTINNPANWWTDLMYSELSDSQLSRMNSIRKEFMIYDYCRDPKRIINGDLPKECSISSY